MVSVESRNDKSLFSDASRREQLDLESEMTLGGELASGKRPGGVLSPSMKWASLLDHGEVL